MIDVHMHSHLDAIHKFRKLIYNVRRCAKFTSTRSAFSSSLCCTCTCRLTQKFRPSSHTGVVAAAATAAAAAAATAVVGAHAFSTT